MSSKVRRLKESDTATGLSLKKSKQVLDVDDDDNCLSSSSSSASIVSASVEFKTEQDENEAILKKLNHYVPKYMRFEDLLNDMRNVSTLTLYHHKIYAIGQIKSCCLKEPNPIYTKGKYLKFSILIENGNIPELLNSLKTIEDGPRLNTEDYPTSLFLIRTLEKGKSDEDRIVVKDRTNTHEVDVEPGDTVLLRIVPENSTTFKGWTFGYIRLIKKQPVSQNGFSFRDEDPIV